jgi:hypothetical protein
LGIKATHRGSAFGNTIVTCWREKILAEEL